MFDIALSVNACVRSKTRADIAWMVSPANGVNAIALTPGGGRIGTMFEGAFDGVMVDFVNRKLPTGRLLTVPINDFESTISGLSAGTEAKFLVVPAEHFDPDTWPALIDRVPVAVVTHLSDDEVTRIDVFDESSINTADPETADMFAKGTSGVAVHSDRVITVLFPITRLVVAGQGPIADAIANLGQTLGWNVSVVNRNDLAIGLLASLSSLDVAIIMGHEVEMSSRNLGGALDGEAGYIGALGSAKMQQDRADWLAYQEVTDLSRVHGPAGIDIGASTPAEIAISVLAQAVQVLKGK
jgi:xanthine dehydrogenase accessory factor